jgi:hypothetical protein
VFGFDSVSPIYQTGNHRERVVPLDDAAAGQADPFRQGGLGQQPVDHLDPLLLALGQETALAVPDEAWR